MAADIPNPSSKKIDAYRCQVSIRYVEPLRQTLDIWACGFRDLHLSSGDSRADDRAPDAASALGSHAPTEGLASFFVVLLDPAASTHGAERSQSVVLASMAILRRRSARFWRGTPVAQALWLEARSCFPGK